MLNLKAQKNGNARTSEPFSMSFLLTFFVVDMFSVDMCRSRKRTNGKDQSSVRRIKIVKCETTHETNNPNKLNYDFCRIAVPFSRWQLLCAMPFVLQSTKRLAQSLAVPDAYDMPSAHCTYVKFVCEFFSWKSQFIRIYHALRIVWFFAHIHLALLSANPFIDWMISRCTTSFSIRLWIRINPNYIFRQWIEYQINFELSNK